MKNSFYHIFRNLCLIVIISSQINVQAQNSEEEITKLVNSINFGVPASPAFELLPETPSQVTHLVTPKDFSSNVTNFFNGTKLRSGVAFDFRPGAYLVGSLDEYSENKFKQILWRSVISLGTVAVSEDSDDAFVSAGLRLSIIDNGDPRGDKGYIQRLEHDYNSAIRSYGAPPLGLTTEQMEHYISGRSVAAGKTIKNVRDEFTANNWNAFKVDAGLAYMLRSKSSDVNKDSLNYDRWGMWMATGVPIGKRIQITAAGKLSWVSADSLDQETNRRLFGIRGKYLVSENIGVSVEGARTWSYYNEMDELDEAWNHIAILLEFKVPFIGGWLGLAYGGDTSRREDPDATFSFNYSTYLDRLIKK